MHNLHFPYLLDRWPCGNLNGRITLLIGLGRFLFLDWNKLYTIRLTVVFYAIGSSACSRVFARDIYGDHVVSCAGIIAIKHRHNVVYVTYTRGMEDLMCVDLTGSSPLTQTELVDFVPGRAVIDVAQRKRGKYMDKCAAIGYGFLPFSFSSLGELEADVITLLKRILKFSMTQDIGARAAVHIFNMISFAIVKGMRPR
nr:hypothetical protein [Tanacetum cinerariifolium]